jgi:DNA-binding CsgD family transcriptional regulator
VADSQDDACIEHVSQLAFHGQARPFRLALITAGQSPHPFILADLIEALPNAVEVTEFGALNDLSHSQIAALHPARGCPSIATRLRSGQPVLVSRSGTHAGIQKILSQFKPGEYDLAAILCTGTFDQLQPFVAPCRLIESQPALENAVRMMVRSGQKIGLIQPLARQTKEDETLGLSVYQRQITWLNTADEADWARVVAESADCEALVLNSLDYDEGAAVRLRRETGMPVILPRWVLASAIRLVLDIDQPQQPQLPPGQTIAPFLEKLTPRERQVMWLMVEGLQSKQISRQLDISPNTVNIHRANVLSKFGVPNTPSLARLVLGGAV